MSAEFLVGEECPNSNVPELSYEERRRRRPCKGGSYESLVDWEGKEILVGVAEDGSLEQGMWRAENDAQAVGHEACHGIPHL